MALDEEVGAGIVERADDDGNFRFFFSPFLLLVAGGTAGEGGQAAAVEEGAGGEGLGMAWCGEEDMEGGPAAVVDDGRFRFLAFSLLVVAVALLLSSCE